jgi:hypothetical protein
MNVALELVDLAEGVCRIALRLADGPSAHQINVWVRAGEATGWHLARKQFDDDETPVIEIPLDEAAAGFEIEIGKQVPGLLMRRPVLWTGAYRVEHGESRTSLVML